MTTRRLHDAFVMQGIGSLGAAQIRFAGRAESSAVPGDLEILTLAGSLSAQGAHLHISVSDSAGRVVGGHVALGCVVRTTVELLIVELPDHEFARRFDPATGYRELEIRPTRSE